MGLEKFKISKGAAADVKELEYISALLQSTPESMKTDGSISAHDVCNLLESRYGVEFDEDHAKERILKGLGGGEDDDNVIDLTELTSILLIPFFRKHMSDRNLEMENNVEWTNLIDCVLQVITNECCEDSSPIVLDQDYIKKILLAFEETSFAEDEQTIEEMLEAIGGSNTVLNRDSLVRAITGDIAAFNVADKRKISTNYEDVFGEESPQKANYVENVDEEQPVSFEKPKINFSFERMDYTVETYRSLVVAIAAWMFFASFFLILFNGKRGVINLDETFGIKNMCCKDKNFCKLKFNATNAGCVIGKNILGWLAKASVLGLIGTIFMIFASVGNSSYRLDQWYMHVISIFVLFILMVPPMQILYVNREDYYDYDYSDDYSDEEDYKIPPQMIRASLIAVFLGSLLMFNQFERILNLIRMKCCKPSTDISKMNIISKLIGNGNIVREAKLKLASARKIERLVNNACDIQSKIPPSKKYLYAGLYEFNKQMESTEEIGGFVWIWRQLLSGKAISDMGMFIPSRIIAGNMCAFFFTIYFTHQLLGMSFPTKEKFHDKILGNILNQIKNLINKALDNLEKNFGDSIPEGFMEIIREDIHSTSASLYVEIEKKVFSAIDDFHKNADAAFVVFRNSTIVFGALSAFSSVLLYMPTTLSTIVKLRTGVIPTLHDENFQRYREDADTSSMIIGSMLFGTFFTYILNGGLFGIILGLFYWVRTREWAIIQSSGVLGSLITTVLLTCVLKVFRGKSLRGFYRSEPLWANLVTVFMECINVGLAYGTIFSRTFKLVFGMCTCVGRVDTVILTPDTERIGPILLDSVSLNFRKLVLSQEAHRHPYIEVISNMFLTKYKHGKSFCKSAGLCWRLIFVQALMPWLRKYRILARSEEDADVTTNSDMVYTAIALS
mmetsp:Transcript_50824/g.99390  ORF Transcript_50824/g.99390 Transcript_50824/m.99390 type:complete len:901 (-) Transcript_50824:360-3062(-)|eukprot:CAMPEP_0194318428 /NCGR_PEP_ID=MMETSP0171-20130528/15026_1 /TAXON_ID=218684 /ORGANISM="Corethron pennatum, Strain L29A3" /LENGTH=900 /DNA_ID=CAMNT_0039075327 /DNA_START=117 /DNA_END=2819 /DNA_ORIENTATION=-